MIIIIIYLYERETHRTFNVKVIEIICHNGHKNVN